MVTDPPAAGFLSFSPARRVTNEEEQTVYSILLSFSLRVIRPGHTITAPGEPTNVGHTPLAGRHPL